MPQDENDFPKGMTPQKFHELQAEWYKIYTRFKEDIEDFTKKVGGKDKLEINVGEKGVTDLKLTYL